MTKEMATAMIKNYTRFMKLSDDAYVEGDNANYLKWFECALALDRVIGEIGYEFKKTWDKQYVIVERWEHGTE